MFKINVMVETIFKDFIETYNKDQVVTNPLPVTTDNWLDDDPFAPVHNSEFITTKTVNTDENGFKEALKTKTPCGVYRETIVIEEDKTTNTIQVKKYFVSKRWSQLKKINKLSQRTHKNYTSLTINLKDGTFVYYHTAFLNRKKQAAYIRKNIINHSILSRIGELFNFNLLNNRTATSILEILNLKLYNEYYSEYNENLNDQIRVAFFMGKHGEIKPTTRLKYFITQLFLDKHMVNYHPSTMINRAVLLKKDKEFCIKYGFNTYYSHITGIDDISFVKNILTKGDEILHNRALKTHNEKETHGKIFVYDQAFKPNIDICNLNIIYNLGYSFEEIVSNEVLTSLVFSDFNNWNDRKIKLILDNSFSNTLKSNKKFFRCYIESYVRLDPSDLNRPLERIVNTVIMKNQLKSIFNVDLDLNERTQYSDLVLIWFCACKATRHSGFFYPSKIFMNRLKRLFGSETKISVHRTKLADLTNELFPEYKEKKYVVGDDDFFSSPQNYNSDTVIKLLIKNKKVNVQLTLTPEYLDFKTIYFKDSDNKKNRIIKINKNETIKKIINLQKRFGNQKSTLDYVGFKATYSKKLFDKFLSDKSFELKEYLVYL